MSIRFRLLLSYLAMLIVPITLSLVAAVILLVAYVGNIEGIRHKPNFFRNWSVSASKIYIEIERVTSSDPDRLLDPNYLEQLDMELRILNTGIIVKKGDSFIYASRSLDKPEVYDKLTNTGQARKEKHPILIRNSPYNVIQYDIKFSDKTPGNLFLLTDIGPIGEFFRNYFSALGITILIIMVLTNGILTYLVSRSIIRPLSILKHGARQIKEGNLNFKIKNISNDEIGQVCSAFEEMRQKLKESLELQLQYEENRKELVASITHDLKTPITSIKGYIEGITDGVANTPEKLDKYIKTIYAKASHLDRLIDDLFLFSKLDLKKLPFNFEKVDIKEYFEDCIEEMRLDLDTKGIQLEFSSSLTSAVKVLADREKLKRVVANVIENSVKYMDKEEGKINIRLAEEKDAVLVEIRDNGQGIGKEQLQHIFERFYRADQSRNASAGGNGLGLAIAKQIVEEHGGRIWAESVPGSGTGIYFTLKKWDGKPSPSTEAGDK